MLLRFGEKLEMVHKSEAQAKRPERDHFEIRDNFKILNPNIPRCVSSFCHSVLEFVSYFDILISNLRYPTLRVRATLSPIDS